MNVDWVVAFAVFMLFVSLSFVYYLGFFEQRLDISQGLDALAGRIVSSLEAPEYSMPVKYDSAEAGLGVLYAEAVLPEGMDEHVKVTGGSGGLGCMLSGDRLYWEADLVAGDNLFTITYSNYTTLACVASLDTSGANQSFPLSAVKSLKLSETRLGELQAMDYQGFRASMAVQNNLRLEWDGDVSGSYGPEPPGNRDVFVRVFTRPLLESPGTAEIRALSWE